MLLHLLGAAYMSLSVILITQNVSVMKCQILSMTNNPKLY